MFVEGASVGRITCAETEAYEDVLNPSECSYIQQLTQNWREDPCGCIDKDTGEPCAPPPAAAVTGCDFCPGGDMIFGDPMRVVDSPGNYFDGALCGDIADLPFDFSILATCNMAIKAAEAFCSCIPSGTSLGDDVCIPQASPSIPGANPCDPDDDSDTCCVGECKFRLTHNTYVCTTKDAETPGPNWKAPPAADFGGDEPDDTVYQAPSGSCSAAGVSCASHDDCCDDMTCLGGSYNFCVSSSGSMGMKSSQGGGGAGAGRKLALKKKKSNSKHHSDKKRRSTLAHKSKNLRQMRK
jgi:hypothetical protein